MMKMKIAAIATWLLCSSILGSCTGPFSSNLRTVVDKADLTIPSGEVRLYRLNGLCAHAESYTRLILWPCTDYNVQQYTFLPDGTIRTVNKCMRPAAFTPGSGVLLSDCGTLSTAEKTWRLLHDRQIFHPASGLVVMVTADAQSTALTMEHNVYSSLQTWLIESANVQPQRVAYIIGMNSLCLQVGSNNAVFIGACIRRWLIYPDGTIRPEQNPNQCLTYNDIIDRRVLVTSCGLSRTNERWVLTDTGALLSEGINSAMDVAEANPDLRRILVYPPSGKPNQKWMIDYQ